MPRVLSAILCGKFPAADTARTRAILRHKMRRLCRRLPGRIGFPFRRQISSNSFTFQYLGHILAFGILAWLSLIIMTRFNYIFGCRMVLALGLFCIVLPAGVLAGEEIGRASCRERV